ncbi:transcription-repair coupling factor [Aquihabitans daechungensis]|uniref:transcription-repair coupling factor n=1 Tax=Aquihabitans daechungensis TaxID=1052257 RepID=UPI003BA387C3
MALTDLPALLRDEPALTGVLGRSAAVLAVPEPARPLTIAGLATVGSRRPILVAVPTTAEAERLVHDLETFLGPDAAELFPAWETLPFERVSPNIETMGRRMRTIWRLRSGAATTPQVVVAPVRALVQRLGPHVDETEPLVVRPGEQRDQAALVLWLGVHGYRREGQVEHRGEFAVRGSIVDVFGSTAEGPVRIDLWGDEVDRLTSFSVSDQRSTDDLDCVEVFPCRELLPTDDVRQRAEALVSTEPWGREQWERLAEGQLFDGMESWLPWLTDDHRTIVDLLPPESLVLVVEPAACATAPRISSPRRRTWPPRSPAPGRWASTRGSPSSTPSSEKLFGSVDVPVWSVTVTPDGPDVATVAAMGWNPVVGGGEGLVNQLRQLLDDGYRVVVAADGEGSAGRLGDLLRDQGLVLDVQVGALDRGVILTGVKLAVLAEADLTGRRRAHRAPRPRKRDTAGFFDDLKPGDYVVHHQHGVGRYGGMVKRAIGGVDRDYLLLEYKGDDKLYVPSDQIDAVRHYTGGDSPALSKLGGGDWTKTKARVKSEVQAVAQELVVLYQKRLHAPGHAFPPDTPWQRELEDAFPYRETPDQQKAIDEVKADMEAQTPMDRLVCGDVGFGKTEVAVRAAFKAIQDGKQVAILVPTTLLATQHFQTFSERFAAFPVRVEVLSRFLTAGQAKAVAEGVRSGEVDCVIGTHRLLSEDIEYKDLGLLVVDEEQRFGVTHKEQIKQFTNEVDVLTLSATPIPRTLELSLTGIRDLTLLNTPPAERQPILTYVGEYDDRAVAEAIRRELLREGQVFFVHNRVRDIEDCARGIRELVPEARVAVAHGQMDEGTLEKVVLDFWEGEFDVLVCTTIIESGIDMPTVNTLVVDRADRLGLGQLHQLRGRVGRSGQRAYAYLFHPRDVSLSEDAYERLKTIGEATELGSGFRIAMRDLEIRGAGTLLGTGQSGHISAVGYDLYVSMVHEAVQELKGEPLREPAEVKLDLPIDANLSPEYVPKEELRLEAYRRLAEVTTDAQVDDIRTEWEDRFGPVPEEACRLLDVARLRAEAHRLGVREINVTKGPAFGGPAWTARVSPLVLKASQQVRLQRLFRGAVYKENLEQLMLPIPKTPDLAGTLVDLLRNLIPPAE